MREIALDTETTGLDPHSGHRIVEIGCVELINKVRTGNHYHVYLNPERDMPREAEQVHGLSAEFLKDKPLFREIAASFIEFIQDSQLIIHNAGFDMKFINAELEKLGRDMISMSRATDTVIMARKKFPGQPASLDALCRRFEIDLSARSKHGALLDAELLAEVYLELCGGKQERLELTHIKEQAAVRSGAPIVSEKWPERDFPISAEEAKSHREFIEKLGSQMLWQKISA